ncbi:MAG: hypothetical protein Q7R66_14985 [Undibacterium sp.]|uniref:phosphoribosyltransferase-like protein n=1 Tax=Undibacterium sp. TaxID=1914977 RepID=UPI00271EBFF7|nr:hypothetical protein [Undibacterium sp.]MDO8653488.1 hypothetical protein [Undibacterium sp.]
MNQFNEDQLDYVDQVFDRAKRLIQARIWGEIKEHRLETWRGCFHNYGAELLGAYLLDNLCFRSRDQFFSMLDTLFLDFLNSRDFTKKTGLVDFLQSRPDATTTSALRIVPVIGLSAPPTKSGPYILRLAQRRYGIRSHWLCWPHQLQSIEGLSDLIFVDDFCGTGEQFIEFSRSIELDQICKKNSTLQITYLVAAAHVEGIHKISMEFPFVHIKCAEKLGAINTVLSNECLDRYQISGFQAQIMAQYQDVVKRAGLPQGKIANGYGKLGLAYGFAHATPNNTLPIFWYETDNWTPLLER